MAAAKRTLEVMGMGEVRARPDQAVVRLGVLTEAESASGAVRGNAREATQVLEAVRSLGICESALSTIGVSVYPVFRYDEDAQRTVIDRYRAENAISVTVPVEQAGEIFDAGVAAGADVSTGITFRLSDERPYRDQAIKAAVRAARADAEAIRDVMSLRLMGPASVDVVRAQVPVLKRLGIRTREAADAPTTPIQAGEITITANVRIAFEISTIRAK